MIDFTVIDGIGQKTSDALIAAGVEGIENLAALSAEEIIVLLTDAGVTVRGDVEKWRVQARSMIGEEKMEVAVPNVAKEAYHADQKALNSIEFSDKELEILIALRDTVSRLNGKRLSIEGTVRYIINEKLRQYQYSELSNE